MPLIGGIIGEEPVAMMIFWPLIMKAEFEDWESGD